MQRADHLESLLFENGEAWVVLGSPGGGYSAASQNASSLVGTNGFIVRGRASRHYLGASVSGAGDFNGDGLAGDEIPPQYPSKPLNP